MSANRRPVERLIEQLAAAEHERRVCNPYRAGDHENNVRRRHNLRLYLLQALAKQPRPPLLVCEAPGYRGCRLTGIPLCSRRLLLEGVEELGVFGCARGYREPTDVAFADIQGEQSATIVWSELRALVMLPLIWNAFPWHPHRPDEPRSNRTPNAEELARGRAILAQVIAIYQPRRIMAVGRSAQASLRALGIAHASARHPAHGGKRDFVNSLRRFAAGLVADEATVSAGA